MEVKKVKVNQKSRITESLPFHCLGKITDYLRNSQDIFSILYTCKTFKNWLQNPAFVGCTNIVFNFSPSFQGLPLSKDYLPFVRTLSISESDLQEFENIGISIFIAWLISAKFNRLKGLVINSLRSSFDFLGSSKTNSPFSKIDVYFEKLELLGNTCSLKFNIFEIRCFSKLKKLGVKVLDTFGDNLINYFENNLEIEEIELTCLSGFGNKIQFNRKTKIKSILLDDYKNVYNLPQMLNFPSLERISFYYSVGNFNLKKFALRNIKKKQLKEFKLFLNEDTFWDLERTNDVKQITELVVKQLQCPRYFLEIEGLNNTVSNEIHTTNFLEWAMSIKALNTNLINHQDEKAQTCTIRITNTQL